MDCQNVTDFARFFVKLQAHNSDWDVTRQILKSDFKQKQKGKRVQRKRTIYVKTIHVSFRTVSHNRNTIRISSRLVKQNYPRQYPVQYLENTGPAMQQFDQSTLVTGPMN